jgi:hypothetical protein
MVENRADEHERRLKAVEPEMDGKRPDAEAR